MDNTLNIEQLRIKAKRKGIKNVNKKRKLELIKELRKLSSKSSIKNLSKNKNKKKDDFKHSDIYSLPLSSLREIAKNENIQSYSKLKKNDLIKVIIKTRNCPSDKVYNRISGRYVDKNGKIGQKIINSQNDNEKNTKNIKNKLKIKNLIPKQDKWVIYSLEGCPFCIKSMELFEKQKIKPKEIKVNKQNSHKIFEKIDSITGNYRYFPIIFLNNKFIGGYDKLTNFFS